MDMGTGKTRTIFEVFDYKLRKSKVNKLVFVCPFTTKENIYMEFKKHFKIIPDFEIYAYETIQSSDAKYLKMFNSIDEKTMLVLDESHFIKNIKSKRTDRMLAISKKAKYKFIMTGTPTPKHAGDLYAQFNFLDPRILGYPSYNQFVKKHLELDKGGLYVKKSHNLDYLTSKIIHYTYQVKKYECLTLPPKEQHTLYTYMDLLSKDDYYKFKSFYLDRIIDCDYVQEGVIFSMYTVLQHICDLSDNKYFEMLDVIENLKGRKIIYFKFIDSLNKAKKMIKANGIETFEYSGRYSLHDRSINLRNWKASANGVLLITYGTGAFSLNLQESNIIIYMNLTFDYSKRIQSEDRIHRIGQDKECKYIQICTEAGIESIINKSIDKKVNFIIELTKEINAIKNNKTIDTRKELQALWERYT